MVNFAGLDYQTDGVGTNYALQGSMPTLRKRLSRHMKRRSARVISELLDTLIGAAAGSAALATYPRVQGDADPGNPIVNGGVRTIETVTLINRNSAAADVTDLKSFLTYNGSEAKRAPATYPTDPSGNTGGGKLTDPPLLG